MWLYLGRFVVQLLLLESNWTDANAIRSIRKVSGSRGTGRTVDASEAQGSAQLRLKQWRTGTLQNEWNSLHSPMTQTPPSRPPSSNFTLLLRRLRNVSEFQTSNVSWWMAQRQQGNKESMPSSALTMSNTAINCHHCQTIAPFDLIDRVMLSPPGNVKT